MNLLQHINIDELDRLLSNKSLSDATLPLPIFRQASFDKGITLAEGSNLPMKAFTNFQIRHFELSDSKKQLPSDAPVKKLLNPQADTSWLAYTSESKVDFDNPQILKQLGATFDAEKNIIFNTYKLHHNSQSASQALAQDLTSFVLILSKPQVLDNLAVGEAVSMQVNGKLSTSATVSWADIFVGSLGSIANLLPPQQSLKLAIGTNVEADFAISIKDEFSLVIVKIAENQFRVSIKKAVNQSFAANISASIGVSIQNPALLTKALTPVIEGFFDLPESKLKQLGEKIKTDQWLDDAERKAVSIIIARLGLSQGIDIKQIPQQIEAKRKSILEIITQIAQTKVQANFAFEYQRLKTEDAFLQAVFTKQALARSHADLVSFKLSDLLANISNNQEVKVENYLHETKIQQRVSWGMGLDFGKWGKLAGKDNTSTEIAIRENIEQKKQVSFVGTRLYQAQEFKNKVNWGVNFKAQMRNFSLETTPKAHEFEYGLQILWEQTENETNMEELQQIIDLAVLWGMIDESEFEKYNTDIFAVLENVRNISYSFQLNIEKDAFILLLPILSRKINVLIGRGLAGGMNFLNYFDTRKSVSKRAEAYAPLWRTYLEKYKENSDWAALASSYLKDKDADLARYEGAYQRNKTVGEYNLFEGLIYLNPNTATQVESFVAGAELLTKGIGSQLPYEQIIAPSFELMQQFWTQSHHIRSLGFYLLETAKNPSINVFDKIGRTLTIKYQADGEQKMIQLTQA